MRKKPNILWLTTDHILFANHYDFQPQYRGRLRTYEKLAAEGRTYAQAYSVCPLCSPARASMLSGTYPHTHGIILNPEDGGTDDFRTDFDRPEELFGAAMLHQGYRVAQFGKWYGGRRTAEEFGFEGWTLPYYGHPMESREYREYLDAKGLPTPVTRVLWNALEPETVGREFDLTKSYRYAFGPFSAARQLLTPKEGHEAYFVADMACSWLEQYVAEQDQRPFVLKADVWGPHHPYDTAAPFAGTVSADRLSEPPNFAENFRDKPGCYRAAKDRWQCIDQMDWPQMSRVLAVAYEHAMLVDDALGLIVSRLDALGLKDNTIVMLTADHGDLLGAHGGLFNKDALMVEEITRIPLVLRWPVHIPAGVTSSDLVTNLDLVPTLLAAGGAPTAQTQGVDLLCNSAREQLMCESFGCYHYGFVQRMLRWKQYKYVAHLDDIEELYDLESDPFELRNLAVGSGHEPVLNELRLRLKAEMHRLGDNDTPSLRLIERMEKHAGAVAVK